MPGIMAEQSQRGQNIQAIITGSLHDCYHQLLLLFELDECYLRWSFQLLSVTEKEFFPYYRQLVILHKLEEKMKTVAITGAEGNIGSRLRKNLTGKYELRLISLKPIPGEEAIVVNIAESMEALIPPFKGVDSVVHLAASPAVDTPWEAVLHNNIIGTYNVFEAARQAGVKQIIFASSNHAVGTYEQEF